MHFPIQKCAVFCFFLIVMLMPALNVFSSPNHFPEYDTIKPNVAFWEKVYTVYASNQGVIHDKDKVNIIYDVIDLIPYDQPDGWEINRDRMKNSKLKYQEIIKGLADGKLPETPDEIRVAALLRHLKDRDALLAASDNIRCQTGQKDRFREGLIRSGAYIDEIKQIFISFGLPVELAYLPHVESSFNYKAYSKFGAAGIWQFTRSTGKQFMRINYAVDERRDPIVSTVAAAKLLKQNYEKLGNWPMAITAYNYGAAGMEKAKNEKGDYESVFKHYRKGWFKFASRNFYSEFLAAKRIAENHAQYFGHIVLEQPQQKRKMVMAGYATFSDVANHLNIDTETLRKHNPALRKPVFREQKYIPKGYRLSWPMDEKYPAVADVSLPSHIYKNQQKHSAFYRVKRGDTALDVALRHRVRLDALIVANNLNRDAVIFVGQNLRIPAKDEKFTSRRKTPVQAPDKGKTEGGSEIRIATLPEKPSRVIAAVTMPDMRIVHADYRLPAEEAPEKEIKLVKLSESTPHEIVSDYAPMFSLSRENKSENSSASTAETKMDASTHRRAGQSLNPSVVTGNIEVLRTANAKGREIGYIQVEVEETIGHYADWLKVTASEIRRLNDFRYGRAIRLHEKIKIPLDRVNKAQFEEIRYEYHKEIEEDFFASYRIGGFQEYQVKKGDNIWTLCYDTFDLPIWLVRNCNVKLDFTNLLASQKLLVPQVVAIQ